MFKKLAQIALLVALLANSTSTAYARSNDTAKTCPVGYSLVNGKCKAIKATGNKGLSKLYWCLVRGGTPAQVRACLSK